MESVYQSFYHPLNQFKGIGVNFDSNGVAYPIINFTNDKLNPPYLFKNMISILKDLGL